MNKTKNKDFIICSVIIFALLAGFICFEFSIFPDIKLEKEYIVKDEFKNSSTNNDSISKKKESKKKSDIERSMFNNESRVINLTEKDKLALEKKVHKKYGMDVEFSNKNHIGKDDHQDATKNDSFLMNESLNDRAMFKLHDGYIWYDINTLDYPEKADNENKIEK